MGLPFTIGVLQDYQSTLGWVQRILYTFTDTGHTTGATPISGNTYLEFFRVLVTVLPSDPSSLVPVNQVSQ